MRTLLETRSLQFLGQRSFSIYLYQEFFFRLAHAGGMPMFPFLVLSVAAGLLGYYLIERPLRSACAARLSRHAMLQPSEG
jgi:peptidoglycan/LPS O-acetylase OafA/YrhL